MAEKKFNSKKDFAQFVKNIDLLDIVIKNVHCSRHVLYGLLNQEFDKIDTNLEIDEMKIDLMINETDGNKALLIINLGSKFELKDKDNLLLEVSSSVDAVYRVNNIDFSKEENEAAAKHFASESAYVHIIAFLRVHIMELVNKSGYPRFILPLFKTINPETYEENK